MGFLAVGLKLMWPIPNNLAYPSVSLKRILKNSGHSRMSATNHHYDRTK